MLRRNSKQSEKKKNICKVLSGRDLKGKFFSALGFDLGIINSLCSVGTVLQKHINLLEGIFKAKLTRQEKPQALLRVILPYHRTLPLGYNRNWLTCSLTPQPCYLLLQWKQL